MVKRRQHIGTFLHNEMGVSLRGISPMCGRSSIHLQKIFFSRSIGTRCTTERVQTGNSPPTVAPYISIPTSARYVLWEPSVGDCRRRPGTVGKVPVKATRWRPTLLHVRF